MPAIATVHGIEQGQKRRGFQEIVGNSPALDHILEQVKLVAPTDASVLILGETGTGKELIAYAIHKASARLGRPFIKVNCASIPANLLESELFGHERGAFTGAVIQRPGRFELAHGGTIFLDEIGELPLELQPKLLRVLQECEFERLGNSRTIRTNARLIAATNRDLKSMVKEKKFRSDLYYRLNVFPIRVPALRERRQDIPLLVRHFVEEFSRRHGRMVGIVPSEMMSELVRSEWPGNIRELQNVIERTVIRSNGSVLTVDLPEINFDNDGMRIQNSDRSLDDVLHEAERTQILRALKMAGGVVSGPSGAAARLRIHRTTLISRMQKLGITPERNWIASRKHENVCYSD